MLMVIYQMNIKSITIENLVRIWMDVAKLPSELNRLNLSFFGFTTYHLEMILKVNSGQVLTIFLDRQQKKTKIHKFNRKYFIILD